MSAPGFYETEQAVAEYLLFHYGTREQTLPWAFGPADALDYPRRCISECLDLEHLPAQARALDLGCAVGRSAFELARHCTSVIGIDASTRFIAVARQLQTHGSMTYAYAEEGRLTSPATAQVPPGIDRQRVHFEHGDAQALRADLGAFDVVLLANLVDRLPDPRRCLAALPARVRPGGQVILTTPCTWLEHYTSPTQWLGGYHQDERPVRTLETLRTLLEPHFTLARTLDLPFLLREHARKYQWSVALATVWIRR
ncbi:MAG: putative 4-mercaptohistidine N1-methyltransferase [Verrucomicrobiales bacterium]|nr:putative 4-mercaptohistidine N1-methyltransferase [Verrucomicrobiales bacterium]